VDKNKSFKLIITILFVVLAGILYSCNMTGQKKELIPLTQDLETKETSGTREENNLKEEKTLLEDSDAKSLYVHICGAVKKPDVYEVKDGTRIIEVIRLAGGLTDEAAGDYINQAALVTDGQQVYIPTKSEVVDASPSGYLQNSNQDGANIVNINTAAKEELMTLPGIGEAKANSIIAYRQENGGFKNIDEIKNIEGIKDSVFNKISELITVK
jgi:competence protein ComEA